MMLGACGSGLLAPAHAVFCYSCMVLNTPSVTSGAISPLIRPGTVVDGLGSPSAPLDFLLVAHSGSVVRAPLGHPSRTRPLLFHHYWELYPRFRLLSDVALDLRI